MATSKTPRARKTPVAKAATGEITNKYDAAGMGRRMAGWQPPSTGPNRAIYGLQKIRDRSRDATRNDWTGESGIQKWTTNLVGIGIVPRAKRIKSKERKQAVQDLWEDFCNTCDADGVLTFYGMQTLGVRAWLESGEVFIRKRPRFPDAGLPVPLQVQLIEAEYVPLLDADSYPGLPSGNTIRSGIERDKRGQRVAYWMFKEHPGDMFNLKSIDPFLLMRIPASEVKHMFMPTRPGQLRGVSMLAPILPKLRTIGDYQDAVLTRQQMANLFVAFISRTLPAADPTVDPLTGKAIDGDFDQPLMPMAPGLIQELEDGQQVTFANPPEAGTMYSDYIRTEMMSLASASGLPYEVFSGDIRQVSDRTLRVLINEFRRFAEQRQWQVIIPMLCQPVRDWFTDAAIFAGMATLAEREDIRRVEWSPHGWSYIHPVQDPQGKQMEVAAGFRSRSSVIGERGDDPETVDQERADDQAREMELGIFNDPSGKLDAHGDEVPEQDGIAPGEYSAPPNVAPKTKTKK
jgi:lambda family phage portal protein